MIHWIIPLNGMNSGDFRLNHKMCQLFWPRIVWFRQPRHGFNEEQIGVDQPTWALKPNTWFDRAEMGQQTRTRDSPTNRIIQREWITHLRLSLCIFSPLPWDLMSLDGAFLQPGLAQSVQNTPWNFGLLDFAEEFWGSEEPPDTGRFMEIWWDSMAFNGDVQLVTGYHHLSPGDCTEAHGTCQESNDWVEPGFVWPWTHWKRVELVECEHSAFVFGSSCRLLQVGFGVDGCWWTSGMIFL